MHRLEALPAATRRALVAAAASESGALDELVAGLASLGLDTAALEPAETAGLIAVADGRVAFQHPLLRSIAYRGSRPPSGGRRTAALAAALTGDQRAWHLAAATVAPDEEVASALAEAAAVARGRGGPAAAMRAAERAARLTPDPERRAGRLLEAASDLARTGLPERAQALLRDALELDRRSAPACRRAAPHRADRGAQRRRQRRPPNCSWPRPSAWSRSIPSGRRR